MQNRKLSTIAWLAAIAGLAVMVWSPAQAATDWLKNPKIKAIYDKAKVEGEVILWGPRRLTLDWIDGEFNKRFPGIKVKWKPDLSSTTKIIAEAQAGRHTVDAYSFALGFFMPLEKRGLLEKVDFEMWGNDKGNIFFNGGAAATHNLIYAFTYNEKLVKPEELPKKWTDLTKPMWKNRLVGSAFLMPHLCAYLGLSWGEEKAANFCRALKNDVNVLATRAPREAILTQGERHAAVAEFTATATTWRQSQGMPLKWVVMKPNPAAQFVIAAIKKGPNPNAAQLLTGWLSSGDAKAARERLRFDVDARPGTSSPLGKKIRAMLDGDLIIEDTSNMKQRRTLSKLMGQIISGQRK